MFHDSAQTSLRSFVINTCDISLFNWQ